MTPETPPATPQFLVSIDCIPVDPGMRTTEQVDAMIDLLIQSTEMAQMNNLGCGTDNDEHGIQGCRVSAMTDDLSAVERLTMELAERRFAVTKCVATGPLGYTQTSGGVDAADVVSDEHEATARLVGTAYAALQRLQQAAREFADRFDQTAALPEESIPVWAKVVRAVYDLQIAYEHTGKLDDTDRLLRQMGIAETLIPRLNKEVHWRALRRLSGPPPTDMFSEEIPDLPSDRVLVRDWQDEPSEQ